MKSKRLAAGLIGIALFVSILLTSVWFLRPAGTNRPNELALDEAVTRIKSKQIKEVIISRDRLEIEDKFEKKFSIRIEDKDEPREIILKAAQEGGAMITFLPASSGYFWILLFNALPVVLFFVMWIVTLAVVVYVAKVLSRNKS